MSVLFVLLDGMEDHPHPDLDGRKPYEVARMPFIRSTTRRTLFTDGRGYTHLFLHEFLSGRPPEMSRAAIEAMGLGLSMDGDRAAFRMSPARVKDGIIEWAYGLDDMEDRLKGSMMGNLHMLDDLSPEIRFFIDGKSILTMDMEPVPDLPGPPVSAPCRPIPDPLKSYIDKVSVDTGGLTSYPWGCGRVGARFQPFPCIKYMTSISNGPTALGVAASLGHDIRWVDDIEERFILAREELRNGHVLLHIDEIDEYSHQKDHRKKIDVLELTDSLMRKYFSDHADIIYFTDHGTSCITGEHILMTVPLWTSLEPDVPNNEHVPLKEVIEKLLGT